MKVTLSPEEMSLAVDVANKRFLYSLLTKGRDSVNPKGWSDAFNSHLLGCIGEIAAAKALDMPWPAHIARFKSKPDLGNRIEVRHRTDPDWELIVRDDDSPHSLFVLSTGGISPVVEVVGWIDGKRAMRKDWRHDHGGKKEAWFVPQSFLLPLDMLKELDNEPVEFKK